MKHKIGLICAIVFVALTGCGHSDSTSQTSPSTTTPDTSSYIGGVCGDQVVRDYSHVTDVCQVNGGQRARIDDACRSVADDFLNKYPSVSCTISQRDGRGTIREQRIEARDVQALAGGDRR